mmetsp:Transcript_44344/g.135142  ORF Transcript_44344/g.135142 Transcript_44344/m.135142 type:complete len:212 (+) Transcript_44344:2500-3135(+)
MTRARSSGWATSRSCRTDTVTSSMKVIPTTQCISTDPNRSLPAPNILSLREALNKGRVAASSQIPSTRGRRSIFMKSRRPTFTMAAAHRRPTPRRRPTSARTSAGFRGTPFSSSSSISMPCSSSNSSPSSPPSFPTSSRSPPWRRRRLNPPSSKSSSAPGPSAPAPSSAPGPAPAPAAAGPSAAPLSLSLRNLTYKPTPNWSANTVRAMER